MRCALQSGQAAVAPLRIGEGLHQLRPDFRTGGHGVEGRGRLREDVVHGGVDLVAVDHGVGHRVADPEPRRPQTLPHVAVLHPQLFTGQAQGLLDSFNRLEHGISVIVCLKANVLKMQN